MKASIKTVANPLVAVFDFNDFVASQPVDSVSYVVRCEAGITVSVDASVTNVITLTLRGGTVGRTYQFGVEAVSTSGENQILRQMVRVRDRTDWTGVPINSVVAPGGLFIFLVNGSGELLVTPSGEALYS